MSDAESLREDGRREDAERRALRHTCGRVNSATEEPPECAVCEVMAEDARFDAQLVVAPRGYAEWERQRYGKTWWQELKAILRELVAPL